LLWPSRPPPFSSELKKDPTDGRFLEAAAAALHQTADAESQSLEVGDLREPARTFQKNISMVAAPHSAKTSSLF
jgi:hypothetical protein